MRRFLALAALLLGAMPAAAQTPAEQSAIDFALARGRVLFAVDRAAWVATDDLRQKMPNFASVGLRGWVVDRDGDDAVQVHFYGGPADAPVAFYRARVQRNRLVSSEVFPADARPALTPLQRRLAAARDAAGATVRHPCANAPFNTAVIPPPTADAPIDVYLMTPQVRAGEYPFGGHYRLTIGADGRVIGERAFANSCLVMNSRQGVPAGGNPVAMVVSHLLDPVPTEIHVFTSIAARMPVFVAIARPERLFEVTGERMRLVRQPPAPRRRK
jgi:hypothetical protein